MYQVFNQSVLLSRGWTGYVYYTALRAQFRSDEAQQLVII